MRSLTPLALLALPLALPAVLAHCSPSPAPAGDAGPDAVANTCPTPTGPGVEHNKTISADETWKASDGPHTMTFGVKVDKGATLTIEPCAIVKIGAGYALVVEGNLVAQGTAPNPITFEAADPSKPWGFLQVFAPGTIKLAYATLTGAGGDGETNSYGAIEARGDQLLPAQEILDVNHVTVNGPAPFGVSLRAGGAFTKTSTALTVAGATKAAMRINPRLATNIPDLKFTGNGLDLILVETEVSGEVNFEDVTFHNRGVPYVIGGEKSFGDLKVGPKPYTLTLEAGVVFGFMPGGWLEARSEGSSSTGVIVAQGTADAPVIFTSAKDTPAPGDWRGIVLRNVPSPAFKLDHVEISYAGGDSQANGHACQPNPQVPGGQTLDDDAALAIYHQPAGQYLTNSVITNSPLYGVDLAYTGTYVDFKATNTFMSLGSCAVTHPIPASGAINCPSACP